MNQYKLSNTIVRDLRKEGFQVRSVDAQQAYQWVKMILKTYDLIEKAELWYDSQGREDFNCWIDVEGPDYGWVFINKTLKDTCRMIKSSFLLDLRKYIRRGGQKIFIGSKEKSFVIVIPSRIQTKEDIYIYLRK